MYISHRFLRQSLFSCLLLYGCRRESLKKLKLLDSDLTFQAPRYYSDFFLHEGVGVSILIHRRRSNIFGVDSDQLTTIVDIDLLDLLAIAATEGTEETCSIIAKFLNTVVSETTLLTAEEVDQFILINGQTLYRWYSTSPRIFSLLTLL